MEKDIDFTIEDEGDENMSGLAIACNSPFITSKKELKRTPMSKSTRERKQFLKTHDFIIAIDEHTKEMKVIVKDK